MRSFVSLLLLLALAACAPGAKDLPSRDAAAWRSAAEVELPGFGELLLDGYDPMGDWRLAHDSGSDWSLLGVAPEARGTWRLSLRRSAWSEATTQVLSDFHHGVLVLSEPLELTPGEHVSAFYQVMADGHELFVPDTRLARLGRARPSEARAGFRRVPAADPGRNGAPPDPVPIGG